MRESKAAKTQTFYVVYHNNQKIATFLVLADAWRTKEALPGSLVFRQSMTEIKTVFKP
jgi:hypothetical protein